MSRRVVAVDLRALVGRPSGIGFFTLSLLTELARKAAPKDSRYVGMSQAPVYGEAALRGAGVELEHNPAPLGIVWQQLLVPRRLRRGDIDVFWSPLLTLPLRLETPAVVTVHDLTPVLFPETHTLKVRLSFTPFIRPTLELAQTVVADSRATADDLRTQFPQARGKVKVVYPGVDADFQPATEGDIEATRNRLDCPKGYVLFVGTLEPRKNIPVLLDAWETLVRSDPTTPPLLLAGGSGWRNRTLLRRIEKLRPLGLRYLDHLERTQLVQLVQAARVVVLPSSYEGFGLPAAEAMASGVPTVVSNASSLPEVVGNAGLLVDPEDGMQLAAAIGRVLGDRDLALDLGALGLERAKRFDWSRAAQEMDEIFDQACFDQ